MAETDESHIDRVWEVIAKAGICMMVTRFVGGLRARPLEARPESKAAAASPRSIPRTKCEIVDFGPGDEVVLPARPRSLDPGARTGHLHLRAGVRQWLLLGVRHLLDHRLDGQHP